MYLKAVEIFGFKSFGEKVYIEFNKGITSIVGPNGSGKSNILDAVLWVLGEQSYKNIRAKESADIIFSGGKDKKPMNSAEVSLFIDNSDSFLPIENSEIKITRKIYVNGENEYYINDVKTRLKDIGKEFIRHYYDYDFDDGEKAFFPRNIDEYAKRIFGEERYYSPELKREAYLYLTFDEKYYQDMKAVIDDVYNTWLKELENYKN